MGPVLAFAALVVAHLKRAWVPVALVSGGGALVVSVVQGVEWNSGVMVLTSLVALVCSTRPEVFRLVRGAGGSRFAQLGAAWAAGVALFSMAVVPTALMAGPSTWSFVGLGLFLQPVLLAAGVFFRRAAVWGAVAVTALVVAALALLGSVWVGFHYAVAIGAEPPSWADMLLWWGIAVVVPIGSMTVGWARLGRKEPVEPTPAPDSPSELP